MFTVLLDNSTQDGLKLEKSVETIMELDTYPGTEFTQGPHILFSTLPVDY